MTDISTDLQKIDELLVQMQIDLAFTNGVFAGAFSVLIVFAVLGGVYAAHRARQK